MSPPDGADAATAMIGEPAGGPEARYVLPSALLHDLRSPLNQILGYSEMMLEQAEDAKQDGFVTDLRSVSAAGRLMLRIMDTNFYPTVTPALPVQPSLDAAGPSESSCRATQVAPATAHEDEAAIGAPATGTAQGLLLVVDDNAANRDVLSRQLGREGYTIETAANGRQALAAVRTRSFDVVLLDIVMPEMDGYQVLQQLKADPALRHIPVVMISALSEMDSVVRCIEMGASDYLTKPFNPTLLHARVGAWVKKKQAADREDSDEHADDNPALSSVVERNIRTIISLQVKSDGDRSSHDRIADAFTSLSGRMAFVYIHVLFFCGWILVNSGRVWVRGFDPFPFGFLNTIVSLEAMIMTTLVLISQNRMGDDAKHRADLDLQIGLLTEHELTRVLKMLDAIQRRVGVTPNPDGTLADLEMETNPEDVLAEIERLQNRSFGRRTTTL